MKKIIRSFSTYNSEMNKYYNSNLSIVKGNTFLQLKNITIGKQLEESAKLYKNYTALYSDHQNKSLTYEELNHEVSIVARGFIGLGIKLQETIGIYAPNCNEWAISQFACSRSGSILVNINPAYQTNDLKYTLNKTKISTLIMPKKLKSSNYLEILKSIDEDITSNFQNKNNLKLKNLPFLKRVILLDDISANEEINPNHNKIAEENNLITWEEFIQNYTGYENDHELILRQSFINPSDPTNIQFTSGTTGLPKGAILSHFNILNNGYLVAKSLDYSYEDKIIIQVPLYHCFGTVIGNLSCISSGATIIYPNSIFDPIKSLKTIEKIKGTTLYGVPTMFLEVLNKQIQLKANISSLRKGIMAGSVCPEYLMNRVINELGITNMAICYGMTELSPISHQTLNTDSFYHRTCSVGRNFPHTITKIVDKNGNIVRRGEEGEVCTKGFGKMIGYYDDIEATNNSLDKEGFMKTGDIGVFDEEGYLKIIGRMKDIIIRGGENISPKEIEDYLGTHPLIDMVQVFGVKCIKFGDEICAWVKLKDNSVLSKEEVAIYCKSKLAHFKIPRYVRFVNEFPMTVTNKPQKYKMRDISNEIIDKNIENMKVDFSKVK